MLPELSSLGCEVAVFALIFIALLLYSRHLKS